MAAIYNNLGNVELATGTVDDAIEYFNRAIPIWQTAGDSWATHLALTYLCVGRAYMFQGKLTDALRMTSQSDALFMRTIGKDRGFMAEYVSMFTNLEAQLIQLCSVHYTYGNIHYRQKNFLSAQRDYESCLKIALAHFPIHPLTVSTYYSLGGVEFAFGHVEAARYDVL